VVERYRKEAEKYRDKEGENKVNIIQDYLSEPADSSGDDPSIPDLESLDPVETESLNENMEAS